MAENQTTAEDNSNTGQHIPNNNTKKDKRSNSISGSHGPAGAQNSTRKTLPHTIGMYESITTRLRPLFDSSGSNSNASESTEHHHQRNHHPHHHHHHHHHHQNKDQPSNTVHRTTSESLRVSGIIGAVANRLSHSASPSSAVSNSSSNLSNSSSGGNMTISQLHQNSTSSSNSSTPSLQQQRKPKTSSFQITSVTVGSAAAAAIPLRSDTGDDSADDLDESHTENETPSMSEDTYSKEDIFFSNNALSVTAPVIPTSAQYGLVIVDPDLTNVGGPNVHVSLTEAGINIVGPTDADGKVQHRPASERFKVVKIESTEPFKRGRWMCMDYLDHTTLSQSTNQNQDSNEQQTDDIANGEIKTEPALTNDSGVNVSENHIEPGVYDHYHVSPGQTLQMAINKEQNEINLQNMHHAQTLTHVPNLAPIQQQHIQQQGISTIQAQSLPPQQLQQALLQQQQQPQLPPENYIPGQSQPTQFFMNQQQNVSTGVSSIPHGATLPANIQMQNGVPINLPTSVHHHQMPYPPQSQPQQQSQPIQPQMTVGINSSLNEQQHHMIHQTQSQPIVQQQQQQQIPTDSYVPQSLTQPLVIQQQIQQQQQQQQQQSQIQQTQPILQQSQPTIQQPQIQQQQSQLQQPQLQQPQQLQQQPQQQSHQQLPQIQQQPQLQPLQEIVLDQFIQQQHQQQSSQHTSQQSSPAVASPIVQQEPQQLNPLAGQTMPIPILHENPIIQQTSGPATISDPTVIPATIQQQQFDEQQQQAPTSGDTESESTSGTSAVAIDNKIEQAMDLVKSHLMIAVREEVEVLKEKITELMEKINQLEVENTILKKNVPQETLSELQLQQQALQQAAAIVAQQQQQQQQQSQTVSAQQPQQTQNVAAPTVAQQPSNGPIS